MIGSIAFHVHGKDVFMYRQSLVIFTLGMCINIASYAASDGTLGTTSSGTVGVSVTVPSTVLISNLSDISVTATDPTPSGETSPCIFTNVPAATYTITATSAHDSAGSFRVNDGSNYVTYTAQWNDEDNPGGTALTSATTLTGQTSANTSSLNCGGPGGSNARFTVTFSRDTLLAAPYGTYTDTVTLLVAPV